MQPGVTCPQSSIRPVPVPTLEGGRVETGAGLHCPQEHPGPVATPRLSIRFWNVTVELKIAKTASGLALSWSASFNGFVLESASPMPAANWSTVTDAPSIVGGQNVVTVEIGSSPRFFRLRKP